MTKCKNFPKYCSAQHPHDNCDPTMMTYYRVNDEYACPTCDSIVNNWLDFKTYHSLHAGQFRKGQKNKLDKCPHFPIYCNGAPPHTNCVNTMRTYYQLIDGNFGCPRCDMIMADWSQFESNHAFHAGQFALGQKQRMKKRITPSMPIPASMPTPAAAPPPPPPSTTQTMPTPAAMPTPATAPPPSTTMPTNAAPPL